MTKFNFCCLCVGAALSLLCCDTCSLAQSGAKPSGPARAVLHFLTDAPSHQTQSIDDALAAFQHRLVRDHKQQFSTLLTKQTVLDAIRSAHQGYEAKRALLRPMLGDYYQKNLALMQQIIKEGAWPKGAYLSAFYQLTDTNGITYQGLGVRLVVLDPQHPGKQLIGSSWPIVDVWYGRIE